LTPEREKQLADSLAFISASTDDKFRVIAVGIEEDRDKLPDISRCRLYIDSA